MSYLKAHLLKILLDSRLATNTYPVIDLLKRKVLPTLGKVMEEVKAKNEGTLQQIS